MRDKTGYLSSSPVCDLRYMLGYKPVGYDRRFIVINLELAQEIEAYHYLEHAIARVRELNDKR